MPISNPIAFYEFDPTLNPPHYIGEATTNSLPLALTGGLWEDDRGWLWLPPIGQSIGSATSGATVANDKLERLYLALWPHLNLATPGYSISSIGASAQTDWGADKLLTIPDYRGRVGVQVGQGSGLTNRTLGATGGEEEHTLSANEAPNLTIEGILGPEGSSNPLDGGRLQRARTGGSFLAPIDTTNDGGQPHNIMQPYYVVNVLWFLGEKA